MKTMPKSLEMKIIEFNNLILKAANLDSEIQEYIDNEGVPYERLVANDISDLYDQNRAPQTEALAYINNGECMTEESLKEAISEIKEVYEYFANKY